MLGWCNGVAISYVIANNPIVGLFFYTTDSNGDYIAFVQYLHNL